VAALCLCAAAGVAIADSGHSGPTASRRPDGHATHKPTPKRPGTTPTASTAPDLPKYSTVGALFSKGAGGVHGCTGSVIASATNNTVITAAHCVHNDAAGMEFIPAYRNGHSREGVWHVTGAYVLPSWVHDHDPSADYAVLTVAAHIVNGKSVELAEITGSESLGTAVPAGTTVTIVAYNSGRDDEPIACRAKVYVLRRYPSFDCHGFVNGSSGSPWLTLDARGHATIHGVIGGLAQGGCHEYTSHSSTFDGEVETLIHRAEQHATPDAPATARSPGC
jgi:V8-like Glu-specific endopeptidase